MSQIEEPDQSEACDADPGGRTPTQNLPGSLARSVDPIGSPTDDDDASLMDLLAEREREITALREQLSERDLAEKHLQAQVELLEEELEEILAWREHIGKSLAWQATQRFCRTIDRVMPPESRRRRALTLPYHGPRRGLSLLARTWKKTGLPYPHNWYTYCFDRYKRQWLASHAEDLTGLSLPTIPRLVSVVLPVYNGEDYVRESIDSILGQTWRDFELIIVNDGSTDSTSAILEEYRAKDDRIRVLDQENQKLPKALSNGFHLARGEYLTWTSADNHFKPQFLEKMVGCLQRHASWDMCWANVDIIGENGEPLRHSKEYRDYQRPMGSEHVHLPEDPSSLNIWPNNYVGAAFLYRARARFLLGDYSPWRFGLEDYDYWMRMNVFLKLRHADFKEPVYDYRFHDTSLTSRDKELGITKDRTRLMVFEDFRRDFALTPLLWSIEGEGTACNSLRERVGQAGHYVCTSGEYKDLPAFWVPYIHVTAWKSGGNPPVAPRDLPDSSLLVLLVEGDMAPETQLPEGWDLCVSISPDETSVALDHRAMTERDKQAAGNRSLAQVRDLETLFSTLDIRGRCDQLARIEAEIENRPAAELDATVIICTYRRSERLVHALQSVARQGFPSDRFETLVVDNAPGKGEVHEQVAEICSRDFDPVGKELRTISCPLKGLSFARNAGIAAARGEVLLFLDDDAIADDDWLEKTLAAFDQNPKAGIIGGKILLVDPEPKPYWYLERWRGFWSHFEPGYDRYTRSKFWWEDPWGANWSARREALLQIGGFRTRYGRVGKDYGGGEEIVAGECVRMLGMDIGVEPASRVKHDVEPDRFTMEHVSKTIAAGDMVIYQAMRDLYIGLEAKIVIPLFKQSAINLVFMCSPSTSRRYEARARFRSAWRLARRKFVDRMRKWRKPICTKP